jgi:tRNA (guanine37-N1)-methyltransferase
MIKRFDILTIFPEPLREYLNSSLLGRAQQNGLVQFQVHQLRDWATDKHRMVDDVLFGGGDGMVMKAEPLVSAIEQIKKEYKNGRAIYLSPQGRRLDQSVIKELSRYDEMLLICGRYEGVDERVIEGWVDEEISLGDFVLCGGEIAALALTEAITRLIPGVVGKEASLIEETFSEGLVEYPHYTRPREFRGMEVPEVLLNGNHLQIERWRRQQALHRTLEKRPDLLAHLQLNEEDQAYLASLKEGR